MDKEHTEMCTSSVEIAIPENKGTLKLPPFPSGKGIRWGAGLFYEELSKEEQELDDEEPYCCTFSIQMPPLIYAEEMKIMRCKKREKIAREIDKNRKDIK